MLLTKIKTVSSTAFVVALVVGGGVVMHSTNASASNSTNEPPSTKSVGEKKSDAKPASKFQGLWKDLGGNDDVQLTKAILSLAMAPNESVSLFNHELRAVKHDPKQVAKWIADLASDKKDVYEAAAKELDNVAPLIQDDLEDAMQNAANDETRDRLMRIILDIPLDAPGFGGGQVVIGGAAPAVPPPPGVPLPLPGGAAVVQIAQAMPTEAVTRSSWKRAIRAVTILECIGTPDAKASLTRMAGGDPGAAPTIASQEALTRLDKVRK